MLLLGALLTPSPVLAEDDLVDDDWVEVLKYFKRYISPDNVLKDRLDAVNAVGDFGNVGAQVGPGDATVGGQLHITVVGPHPDDLLGNR